MKKAGALEGETMAGTFDILRANDLIFNYVVSNWLMGQPPPAFDILAWNADSTRMPAAMHAFYLRNFYVQNKLASGELQIAGATIDLSVIKHPMYVVSAINDHIVPWQSAYKTVGLVSGPVRFVLGSGGHIAGIVSPPGPKAWHMVSDTDDALPTNAEDWRGSRNGTPVRGGTTGPCGPRATRATWWIHRGSAAPSIRCWRRDRVLRPLLTLCTERDCLTAYCNPACDDVNCPVRRTGHAVAGLMATAARR